MLTRKQLNSLFINAFAAKMLLTFPHNIIEVCKNAAWISSIYIVLLALLLFGLTAVLYRSDKNIIQLAEKYGGKPLRIITGVFIFAVLFMNFFSVIRIFSEAVRLVLLQTSRTELIGILLAVCIVLGACCGIEAIARFQQLFLPIAGLAFAAFIIFLIPTVKPDNAFPILGSGAGGLFIDNIPFLSVFSDLLILNLLIPLMEESGDYKRSGIGAIIMGGIIVILIITAYCLSYTYPVSEEYLMPVYQLERLIKLGSFFSRLEAVFQFIWSISILLYCSFYLCMMAQTWKTTFALRDGPPLIPVIAVSLIGASIMPDSLSVMIDWESIINKWVYIPAFGLPIIFGITEKLFHVKHSEGGEK